MLTLFSAGYVHSPVISSDAQDNLMHCLTLKPQNSGTFCYILDQFYLKSIYTVNITTYMYNQTERCIQIFAQQLSGLCGEQQSIIHILFYFYSVGQRFSIRLHLLDKIVQNCHLLVKWLIFIIKNYANDAARLAVVISYVIKCCYVYMLSGLLGNQLLLA